MIEIRLKQAMDRYQARTGERLTYAELAERTGVSRSTLESMATRPAYNASLKTIDVVCSALECAPCELLHHVPDQSMGSA